MITKATARRKAAYHLRALTVTAVMVALAIVLERVLAINTQVVKIGFYFIPIAFVGILYGPFYATVAAALSDLIGAHVVQTGAFFPGFTLTAAVSGLFFGLFLWRAFRRKHPFLWVLPPVLLNNLVVGLVVNTLLISLYFSPKGFWTLFWARLSTQYAILIPVQLIFLPILVRVCRPLYARVAQTAPKSDDQTKG